MEKPTNQEKLPTILLTRIVVMSTDNKILLIQRSADDRYKPNTWELPGGKWDEYRDGLMNQSEDILATAQHELFEECGINYPDQEIRSIGKQTTIEKGAYIPGNIEKQVHYFVQKDIDPTTIQLSREHQSYQWVLIEDLHSESYPLADEHGIRFALTQLGL